MSLRPAPVMAIVAVGWGSIGVLVRQVHLPAVAIVASRVSIGSVGLALYLACGGDRRGPALLSHRPVLTTATGVLLAAHWLALFSALQRAPIGTVLLITYMGPVLVALGARRVLGERVAPAQAAALAVAVCGCALVVGGGIHGSVSGLLLAATAAVSYAGLTLLGKGLAEYYGGVRLALQQQAVATLVLVPFALGVRWGTPRAAWGWLVVLGLVHTAAGTALFFAVLARLPATVVGLLGYLEPASAVVFGWVVLSEQPSAPTLAGGGRIVVAGVVASRSGAVSPIASPEVAGAVR